MFEHIHSNPTPPHPMAQKKEKRVKLYQKHNYHTFLNQDTEWTPSDVSPIMNTYFTIHANKHITWLQTLMRWTTRNLQQIQESSVTRQKANISQSICKLTEKITCIYDILTTESTTSIPVSSGGEACLTI